MKIGIIQIMTTDDKEKNLKKAADLVAKAASEGAEVICLPEMFSCPMQHKYYKGFAEEKYAQTYKALSDMAKDSGVYLIGGSVPELLKNKDSTEIYNTSWVFDTEGREIYEYKKRRLFDISLRDGREFKESKTFTKGCSVPSSFDTVFGKVGLAICFELRFPEDFIDIEKSGAKIIFVPANFSKPTGKAHWELLFRSRALDNQLFVIGVSSAVNSDSKFMTYGHSILVDPWGDVLWQAGEEEVVKVLDIDFAEVDRRREELPVALSRR